MRREEIAHLGHLSRIELTEEELVKLESELSSIVSYVGVISDIAADENSEPKAGARFNIFRKDVVTNDEDQYTQDLLAEMPATEGRLMKVKKILGATE